MKRTKQYALRNAASRKTRRMEDYARLRKRARKLWGDDATIAERLGVSYQTLKDWRTGRTAIPAMAWNMVTALEAIR